MRPETRQLRREYMQCVCRALSAYIEAEQEFNLRSVWEDDHGSIVFSLEHWDTFDAMLRDETNRRLSRSPKHAPGSHREGEPPAQ